MQILEQLAGGYSVGSVNEAVMSTEFASFFGYMEFMQESWCFDLSGVPITEGVIQNAINLVRKIIDKLIALFKRFRDFLKQKLGKLRRDKKEDSTSSKERPDISEWLEKNPYNGPLPGPRQIALNKLKAVSKSTVDEMTSAISKILEYVSNSAENKPNSSIPDKESILKDICTAASNENVKISAIGSVPSAPKQLYDALCKDQNHSGSLTQEGFYNWADGMSYLQANMFTAIRDIYDDIEKSVRITLDSRKKIDAISEVAGGNIDMSVVGIVITISSTLVAFADEVEKTICMLESDIGAIQRYIFSAPT